MPLQGATAPTHDTQGAASLALGYVPHWAFSPPLHNPKFESLHNCVYGHMSSAKIQFIYFKTNICHYIFIETRLGKAEEKLVSHICNDESDNLEVVQKIRE